MPIDRWTGYSARSADALPATGMTAYCECSQGLPAEVRNGSACAGGGDGADRGDGHRRVAGGPHCGGGVVAEGAPTELDAARAQVLAARERGDADTEQALTGTWRLRLQELLEEDSAAGPGLRRLLGEHLAPALAAAEQARVQQIIINAQARDQARQYIAGRDQHISGS